ncbi:acetylcholine receptor subunit beta-like [Mercenaria mercenaria]|uniref:acetylcholine receptor subunit beta-like n=1 Tax=Mercenaria mercenaria TaxID=6596 RepID=UPI00234F33CC|nr:acetylcholine receptor subunit beta-like [Mercenaria mercenaria]
MLLLSTFIFFSLFCRVLCQSGSELSRLKTTLFTTNGYNTKVRPVSDQNDVTSVSIDFALVGINSFNDADQKLTTTGYLTVKWTDELLVWTPSDYDNIQSILVPQNEVWKPDITLDNGMESKSSLGQTFIQVTIYANGSVSWSPYEVFQTSCAVNIIHFPFDKQTCDIKFMTYMHDDTEVRLQFGSQGFYQSNFEKNGKWDIESMTTSSETANGKTVITFTVNLQRKSSFYILFLIVPAILLSILNAFVFVLPAGSGEKVGYTIAVFLSYALFYTILSESLPKNSDTVSTIAAYLFFMMFLSTLATIITIIELRIYNKKTRGRLPVFVVHFVKCILFQRCLCKNSSREDFSADHLDGNWTKVIGPWLDCDWKDFIDALDFILFWLFLVGTIVFTVVALVLASSYVSMF